MKKLSVFVIVIPLLAAALLVAGAIVWRMQTIRKESGSMTPAAVTPAPSIPALSGPVGKPTVGFGSLQSSNPVGDLRSAFDALTDDGGAASISALEKASASL